MATYRKNSTGESRDAGNIRIYTRRELLKGAGALFAVSLTPLVAACGGNTSNKPSAQKSPEQMNLQSPPTEVSEATSIPTSVSAGGTMPRTTQQPVATVSRFSLKEAPELAQQVKAGKLPPVEQRVPDNPMVLQPVERVGRYSDTWHSAILGPDTATLTKTIGYEHLMSWDPAWTKTIPNIAEGVDVNKDSTEYTFKLRKGMKWSDGKPFTADDIVFWYEDVLTNKDLTPAFPDWLTTEGKPVVVKKTDDQTVVFKFSAPNGLLLLNLASVSGGAPNSYPAHYLKQFHKKYNPDVDQQAKKAKMDSWTDLFFSKSNEWENSDKPVLYGWKLTQPLGKSTQLVVAERNPYYWKVDPEGNQLPYINRVQYKSMEKIQVMVLNAANGELDMIQRYIGTTDNKPVLYKNQKKGDYHFFKCVPSKMNSGLIYLNLNHKDKVKRKLYQNKSFRIGLSHAINRKEIIDVVFVGQSKPWQAAPRPDSPFYSEKLATQYTEYDVKKANQYLDKVVPKKDQAGFRLMEDGKRITISVLDVPESKPYHADMLELVKKYWRDVGIDMTTKPVSKELRAVRTNGNQHDATIWDGDTGEWADILLDPTNYVPVSPNSFYAVLWADWYNNPDSPNGLEPPAATKKQMKLYDQLRATADYDGQVKLMKQILDIAADEFYVIGINLYPERFGIAKSYFHNVPKTQPWAWVYPNPAPTNPQQYYMDEH